MPGRATVRRAGVLALACVMAMLSGCGASLTMSPGTGVFVVSPSTVAFGNVPVGQTSTMRVVLENKTLTAVQITSLDLTGTPFALASTVKLPVTVESGASYSFVVQFAPTAAGTSAGSVTVSTNAAVTGTTVVEVSGTGTGTSPATAVPSALNCTTATLTGAGTTSCAVKLSAAAPAGGLSVNLASNNSAVTVPATVTVSEGGTSASFTATAAAVSNTQTATVTATANSGSATTALTLNASGPVLTVNANAVAFGAVLLGVTATQEVTLTSAGTQAVTVNSAMLTGSAFLLTGGSFPATLNPGQTATISVAFVPLTLGTATGALTIASTSATNPTNTVALTGTGSNTYVALTWDAPTNSDDPVENYRVYRSAGGSSSYASIGLVSVNATTFSDTAVADGTTYEYYVTSVDAEGVESMPSNTATVSVP